MLVVVRDFTDLLEREGKEKTSYYVVLVDLQWFKCTSSYSGVKIHRMCVYYTLTPLLGVVI